MKKIIIAALLLVSSASIAFAADHLDGLRGFHPVRSVVTQAVRDDRDTSLNAGNFRPAAEFQRIMGMPLEVRVYPNGYVLARGLVVAGVSSSSIQGTFAQGILPISVTLVPNQNTIILDYRGRRLPGEGSVKEGDILSVTGTISTTTQGSSTPSISVRIVRDWTPGNRVGAGTGTTTASTTRTITMNDNNSTVGLRRGDSFLLQLGEGYNWNVTVADPAIISRVTNISVVRGVQGVYRANAAGTTTLLAVGNPNCSGFFCSFRPTVRFQATTTVSE